MWTWIDDGAWADIRFSGSGRPPPGLDGCPAPIYLLIDWLVIRWWPGYAGALEPQRDETDESMRAVDHEPDGRTATAGDGGAGGPPSQRGSPAAPGGTPDAGGTTPVPPELQLQRRARPGPPRHPIHPLRQGHGPVRLLAVRRLAPLAA